MKRDEWTIVQDIWEELSRESDGFDPVFLLKCGIDPR